MRIIVTAGPARECIDDVRFFTNTTNASSGPLGFSVAVAAIFRFSGMGVSPMSLPAGSLKVVR